MSKFSVKKPYTIFVGVIMILLLGFISFTKTTTDLLPAMELPYVVVYTPYPGASAEKVEKNVTRVIESSLGTTENLLNITSVSNDNISLVILEFAENTNMDTAKIDLSTKINQAKSLLESGVATPTMMAINPNMLPIMMTTVDYEGKDLQELSDFVKNDIQNELAKTPGVAEVSMNGLLEETIQVTFDQDKIDNLNNKLLNSVSKELAKADKEINDGLKEINEALDKINNGQNELNDKKNETFDKLSESSIKLNEAATQLIALDSQIQSLKSHKLAFEATITSIEAIVEKTPGVSNAEELKSFAENSIKSINELNNNLNTTIENLNDDNFEIIKNELSNNQLLPAEIFTRVNDAQELKVILNDIIKNNEKTLNNLEQLKEAGIKYEDAKTRLNQIEIEILTSETVKKTIADMLIANGIDVSDLNKLQAQVESGKLIAVNEITVGQITLNSTKASLEATKAQLEDAKKKLDESKKEALKQANIDALLSSDMLANIMMAENFNMPAGYLQGDNSLLVKVGEEFKSLDELKNLLLVSMDIEGLREVKLSDVAKIEIVNNADSLYTKVNGNDAIILTMQKTSTSSTSDVSSKLNKTFTRLEKEYEGLNFTNLMDQGVYINLIISSVLNNFISGGILAIIVLIIFLKSIKPTLIIAFSIPISFMFAMVLMYFSGVTLNIISLSGLALGVGMLVDNSVVVVENIYRLKNEGKDIKEASIEGAKQVAMAITASTLTTVCVFLPIVFAEGITRQLFTDMGLTIAYSLFASLIVALTLVPTLSSLILKNSKEKEHKLFDKIINVYTKTLKWVLSHRLITLVLVIVLFIFSIFNAFRMGMELLPQMDSPQMSLSVSLNDEDADEETKYAIYDQIMHRIKNLEDIEAVGINDSTSASIGVMTMMGGSSNSDSVSFNIVASDDANINKLKQDIPSAIADLDIKAELQTSQMDMSALSGSGVTIRLFGDDLDSLKEASEIVKETLNKVDGIKEIITGNEEAANELRIIVDKNKAMKYGLTVAQVYQSVAANLKSETSSVTLELDDKEYPLVIVSEGISSRNELKNISLSGTKDQEKVDIRLDEITNFVDDYAMSSINRENSRRYISVSATIEDGYNISLVSREVNKVITNDILPDNVELEFSGENETIMEAMVSLLQMIALAIAFIYMIMVAQFQSLKSPFIVMFTIPLAFTGGLLALGISGLNLSITSMLGFLVLSGVVVNNGIVLIDYVNQLRQEGVNKYDSLIIAGKTRMRPILMTALTTILAMTTMAMAKGMGASMSQGMAIVTIGGLSYATILTLYIVPVLISLMDKKDKQNER